MDIHILHDGKQSGPHTEDAVHALLKQGSISVNDLAWRPGMTDWMPLIDVIHPAAPSPPPPPPPEIFEPIAPTPAPAPAAAEPATPRQQAFLHYMHVTFAPDLTREKAALLVNNAMENPKDPARLARWNEERLLLHPELFAAEIQMRKENRPQRYLEICQQEGAPFFDKVTKAHCQVLVGHLDVRFPNWDAYEHEAAQRYFFPALAEKFPQLVTAEGKGRFRFEEAAPVARKTAKQTPVVSRTLAPVAPSVFSALVRGVIFGLIILGGLWGGREYVTKRRAPAKRPPAAKVEGVAVDAAAPSPPKSAEPAAPATTRPAASDPAEAKSASEAGSMTKPAPVE